MDTEQLSNSMELDWECTVSPDKEYLQQTHLVCVIPPYRRLDLGPSETVNIKLFTVSSGKTSEPHNFMYTAATIAAEPSVGKLENTPSLSPNSDENILGAKIPSPTIQAVAGNTASNGK